MESILINLALAFFEGFALIITPCILPVLPIILSGSLSGSRLRPYGIILGFVLSFVLFTFFSRQLVKWSGIDLNLFRNISLGLLVVIGLVMIFDYLSGLFGFLTRRLANLDITKFNSRFKTHEFPQGLLFGALIGLVWTPCAGPILAAVIVQSVLQQSNITGFFTVLSFGIGAGVPMLLIALFGRRIMGKFDLFKKQSRYFRKIIGLVIVLSAAYLFFSESLTLSFASNKNGGESNQLAFINGISHPYAAPAIEGIDNWINTKPFNLSQLKGKVVLIDFWTYSCINCIRTLPYLKSWFQKYHDSGFIIIGVHTPEFEFEKNFSNVSKAVKAYGIEYPVVLDNRFVTWINFKNQYWPAHYLINKEGNVVYTHFGEGEYDVTENNIRFLLGMQTAGAQTITEEEISTQTPETYLGYARADGYDGSGTIKHDVTSHYAYPHVLSANSWALNGDWQVATDKITSTQAKASLKIHFNAKKVFAVMGSSAHAIKVKLLLNGEWVELNKGEDVTDSAVTVGDHKLYSLINLKRAADGILELTADTSGLEVYTFTFG